MTESPWIDCVGSVVPARWVALLLAGLALGACNAADLKVARPGVDGAGDSGQGAGVDDDADGHTAAQGDCNDADPAVHPGAEEACNGQDDDCDGEVDEGLPLVTVFQDGDEDGHGDLSSATEACAVPDGWVSLGGDCDDTDPGIHPAADEPCGGGDRDCDGVAPDACRSCLDLLQAEPAAASGVYEIDLETEGLVSVWCDMDTDGGGWTLVQRTIWDWAETSALWTSYEVWYRDTLGAAEAGRAFRLAGRAWGELAREQDVLVELRVREEGGATSCAPLHYRGTGARVLVSNHAAHLTGMSADVPLTSGETLSATDAGPSTGCTASEGVPWFYGGCCSTCPSYGGGYWTDGAHPMVSYADSAADLAGRTTAEQCSGAPVRPEADASYVGVDILGVYLR